MAAGDRIAFHSLFEQYRIPLFSFALEITRSPVDAEDIVQEIFIKIWEQRNRLAEVREARPYIYAMARNHTFDWLQKVARNDQLKDQLWANSHQDRPVTEEQVDARESQRLIEEAVSRLSPAKQQVFRLSREAGLDHQQIADRLGLSKSRVKNILVECLQFIRYYLQQHSPLLALVYCLADRSFFH